MKRMIAYCGLVCSACDGYLATQANDTEWLERLAAHARSAYNAPETTINDVMCDGCKAESTRLCAYCAQCGIRACASARSVETCADCDEYETCAQLNEFVQMVPDARATLDSLRFAR